MEPLGVDKKTAKGPSSQILAPAIQSGIDQKLHCLVGPAHLGVLTPAEKPKDVEARSKRLADVETGGQKQVDAEVGSQRPTDAEAEGQR